MGGWTSKLFGPNETPATHHKTVWQKEGYYEDYSKSPLLSNDADTAEQEELLGMLDSASGQYFLGRFSAEVGTQQGFHAWSDIQEFKAIPTDDYRYFKAKQFANKYLGNGPKELKLDFVPADVREDISKCIAQASEDRHILGGQLFSSAEKMIFQEIYNVTFKALKKDHADRYNTYVADRAQVNRIDVDDFDYLEKIAEGTFGRVVHVVKKTTGQHYAMKIQFKLDLCRTYKHDLSGVLNEKNVLVKCHHALLVHLDYALQTELHVILVLKLATSGTIQDAIDAAPGKRLDEERARFYAAEITLALMYLHDNKLMYRDLKPRNVMLGMDGHIQLGDMGGAAQSADKSGHKIRRRSVMGTKGYMAPEVAGLMDQSHRHGEGYTDVADWYSLGVTTYKMLTGMRLDNQPRAETTATRKKSFVAMLQPTAPVVPTSDAELEYPPSVSDSAKAFVSALLLPESERLGSGETGNKDIQSHPFMEGIEWEELEAKRVKPPYMPAKKSIGDGAHFASFEEMMEILQDTDGRSKKARTALASMTIDEQKCFGNFHYVSPQTLKREMGLSRGVEDIEPTFKMVQLTGESSLTSEAAKTNTTFRRTGKVVKHVGRALTHMSSNVSNSSAVAGSGAGTAPGSPHSPSPFPKSPVSQPNGSSVHTTDASSPLHQAGRPNVRPRIALVTPPPL